MQARRDSVSDSRSASKHVLFALGVDLTARDACEGRGFDLVSQATPFALLCESSHLSMFSRHTSLIFPSLARRQANAVEIATNVCSSL